MGGNDFKESWVYTTLSTLIWIFVAVHATHDKIIIEKYICFGICLSPGFKEILLTENTKRNRLYYI